MKAIIALKKLEPYAVKVARTVLRGLRGSNAPRLPDQTDNWNDELYGDWERENTKRGDLLRQLNISYTNHLDA